MIVRAVSDSDSDDDLVIATPETSYRVFDPPDVGSASAQSRAARCVWLAGCGASVLLLLVDLAAIFDPSPDVFALLPLLVTFVFYPDTIILPPIASILNQFVGLALVAFWIYRRETSLASRITSQWFCRTRYGLWTVMALLCLGHIVSCLYLLYALLESNGDRATFWLGRKHLKKHNTKPSRRV